MARNLLTVWTSTTANKDQANQLADFINERLTAENKVIVVELSSTWYVVAGNAKAKAMFEKMKKELEAREKAKAKANPELTA